MRSKRRRVTKSFFEKKDIQDSDAWIEDKCFLIQFSSTGIKHVFETLTEEIKPLVFEKNEFERREKSITVTFIALSQNQNSSGN